MFSHYSSFIPLVLVLFVSGTFVTHCVTVTNSFVCLCSVSNVACVLCPMLPVSLASAPGFNLWGSYCTFRPACVFTFLVPCFDVHYDFRIKTMFVSFYPNLFVGDLISYLWCLCLLHIKVSNILSYHMSFAFSVPCCDVRYDFRIKRWSVRLCPQFFVGGLMAYLGRNSLPFPSTWVHSRFFGGVRVTHL